MNDDWGALFVLLFGCAALFAMGIAVGYDHGKEDAIKMEIQKVEGIYSADGKVFVVGQR